MPTPCTLHTVRCSSHAPCGAQVPHPLPCRTCRTGNFDAVAELLLHGGSDRPIHEAVMMMVPEAWRYKPGLSDAKRAMMEFNSAMMEP